jgi:hypothetical protein
MSSKSFLRLTACLSAVLLAGVGLSGRIQSSRVSAHTFSTASSGNNVTALALPVWVAHANAGPIATGHRPAAGSVENLFVGLDSGAAPQAEKTVDQTRKNIQVLKGLPDSQLIPVMNLMSASLGVNCAFCHVPDAFEKDDKPEKAAARKMIQMVMDTNTKYFNGRHSVSCYTCHKGQEHPVSLPPVAQLAPAAARAVGERRSNEGLPTVEQVMAKYVAAVGGQVAIEKQKTRVLKGTQTGANGASSPVEIYQAAPDKYLAVMHATGGGDSTTGYDGAAGWMQGPRGKQEMSGEQLEIFRRAAAFSLPLRITDLYPKMRLMGQDKVGDRAVYIVGSQLSDRMQARLYFDVETGLLLRVVTLNDTIIGRIPQQTDYEDYRDVDGVKIPFRVKQSGVDARSGWTRTFTEIKAGVPVDSSKFAAPTGRS